MGFALATQREWNLHKKKEMYMANARILHWDPTPPIFHWLASGVGVWANANFRFGVGGLATGNAKNVRQLTQKYYFLHYLTQMYPTPVVLRRSGI